MTWQQHLKKCAAEYQQMKLANKKAQKAKEKGLDKVAFDRSGFKYHGRIKALAEAAREAGLQF